MSDLRDGSGNQLATQAFVNSAIASSSLKGSVAGWKTLTSAYRSSAKLISRQWYYTYEYNTFSHSSLSSEFYAEYGETAKVFNMSCSITGSCGWGVGSSENVYSCSTPTIYLVRDDVVYKTSSGSSSSTTGIASQSLSAQTNRFEFSINKGDTGTYYYVVGGSYNSKTNTVTPPLYSGYNACSVTVYY